MKLIVLLFSLIPTLSYASPEVSDCGEYTVKGIIKARDNTITLVVNERTYSEHIIKFPVSEMAKVALFLDNPVIVKLEFVRKFNGNHGISDKVVSVETYFADNINQDTKRIALNKKLKCLDETKRTK